MPCINRKIHAKIIAAVLAVFLCVSCSPKPQRYVASFIDLFDSYVQVIGYARSRSEFDGYVQAIRERLDTLHSKYDIYNGYSGLNNLKTINDNAGLAPIPIDKDVAGLLEFGKQAYEATDGAVNIAMGPVLKIWHDYRERGLASPENAGLPPTGLLLEQKQLCDIEKLIVDEEAGTACLAEKGMSLDVGAIAKGYAARLIAGEARQMGMTSALINLGGNIVATGAPLYGEHESWRVGIQDPRNAEASERNIIGSVYVKDAAVVTSGDYQRFYTAGGKRYNHIVDPETLMPAERHAAVTVIAQDPAIADMLSTCLFIFPEEQGRAILEKNGGEALWVGHDGETRMTDGYRRLTVDSQNAQPPENPGG